MKFTYNIQKINFFTDQVEEKGEIDLEGAINAFQSFPFEDQLKEASYREESTCYPTITLKNKDRRLLAIWAIDNHGFYLLYENENNAADWYLADDYYLNPKGFTVEEFIELFFNNKIEESIKLQKKKSYETEIVENQAAKEVDSLTFKFADSVKYTHYLWTIPFLLFALYLFFSEIKSNFKLGLIIHLLVNFFWLPATILHITYWFKNQNAVVKINKNAKTIEYIAKDKFIHFHRSDIEFCELNETHSYKAPWKTYKYLYIKLKDKRRIVITNFITEPETIIDALNLNYKVARRIIPFLPI